MMLPLTLVLSNQLVIIVAQTEFSVKDQLSMNHHKNGVSLMKVRNQPYGAFIRGGGLVSYM